MSVDLRLLARCTVLVGAAGLAGLLAIGLLAGELPAPTPPPQPAAVLKSPAAQALPAISYSGPEQVKTAALQSLNALLAACPTLRGALHQVPAIALTLDDPASTSITRRYGWHRMLEVEADLPDGVMAVAPAFFRDPQWGNHVLIRLGGGRHPGAVLDWPTTLWLCDMDDELGADFLSGRTRTWRQRDVLKPVPALQPLEPVESPSSAP